MYQNQDLQSIELGGATLPYDSLTTVSCFGSQVALPQALQCQSKERRSAMLMVHDHCLHATACVNLQLLNVADLCMCTCASLAPDSAASDSPQAATFLMVVWYATLCGVALAHEAAAAFSHAGMSKS